MVLRSLALVIAVATLAWAQDRSTARPMTLRILTYNIHHGEGFDGEFDLPRQAAVITSASPDLVALQEVDEGTRRSGGVRQAVELGRLTGLHPIFGEAMEFEGGQYGVAILSRWPIVSNRNQPLPGLPNREPRTALTAVVRPWPAAPPISFTSTHLDFGRGDGRDAQAHALNEFAASDDGLSILAGDLNSAEDSEVLRILRERWTEIVVPGITSMSPGRPGGFRLDYLLIRPAARWRIAEARLVDGPLASDHIPVLAVLDYLGPR